MNNIQNKTIGTMWFTGAITAQPIKGVNAPETCGGCPICV